MHLTPREVDKLVLHGAGVLAQKRLARGLRLNQPEAVALKLAWDPAQTVRFDGPMTTIFVGGRQMMVEMALNSALSWEELVV